MWLCVDSCLLWKAHGFKLNLKELLPAWACLWGGQGAGLLGRERSKKRLLYSLLYFLLLVRNLGPGLAKGTAGSPARPQL